MIESQRVATPEEATARMQKTIVAFMTEKFKMLPQQDWDVKQTADYLNVSHRTIYNWLSLQKRRPTKDPIPFKKISHRCVRFPNNELIAWAKRRWIKKWTPRPSDYK